MGNEILSVARKRHLGKLAEFVALEHSSSIDTDLAAIARFEEIEVYYDSYERAFDGMLVADGTDFHIHIDIDNGNNPSQRRSRFTLAHELGHFFIDEHRLGLLSGELKPHPSRQDPRTTEPIEVEANYFASCLLMPESKFKRSLTLRSFSSAVIEKVTEDFNVSFPAATIRFAAVGNHEIMAVVSKDGIAKWYTKSDDFFPGRFKFKVGSALPPTTVAGEHFAGKNRKLGGIERLCADDWFYPFERWANLPMYEQCVYRDEWGYVISLLWFD
jgi:Zn-dependent peptidase ImmA (M78 family)